MEFAGDGGEAKEGTDDGVAIPPRFHGLCIGMDNWTKDATMARDLLVNDLNYLDGNVHVLNAGPQTRS